MKPTKEQQALQLVQELAKTCKTARDLHNAFFGIGAPFGKMFPTRAEREAFSQTPEYKQILQIRADLQANEKSAS